MKTPPAPPARPRLPTSTPWIGAIIVVLSVVVSALLATNRGSTVDHANLSQPGVDGATADGRRDGTRATDDRSDRGGTRRGTDGQRLAGKPGGDSKGSGSAGSPAGGGTDPSRPRVIAGLERSGSAAAGGARGVGPGPGGGATIDARSGSGDSLRPDVATRDLRDIPKSTTANGDSTDPNAEIVEEPPPPEPAPEVAFDGGADKTFSTDWQIEIPDAGAIAGDAGTVSFWLKPGWEENNQNDATFVQLGDSGMHIAKNVNYLRFEYFDSEGNENGLGTNIGEWKTNEWRQVTASWAGPNLALYVDGQLISQNRFNLPPTFANETKLYVGSPGGAPVAPGDITYLKVTNSIITPADIAKQYQSGPRPR
ncbi:MAG: LamG-like jellyroll fold domain-containing protein [Candidatus Binatia bacterium]